MIWSENEYFNPKMVYKRILPSLKFTLSNSLNPLAPISDQDRISPCDINTINIKQISDKNKEKYQLED